MDIVAVVPLMESSRARLCGGLIKEHGNKVLVEEFDTIRADGVHKEVLSWLKETKERVIVLSGLSGSGDSLLKPSVIPELREGNRPFGVLIDPADRPKYAWGRPAADRRQSRG
jgi:hypothetical protein